MQRLFLVRHAETAHNQLRVLRGKASAADVISELGQKQARACARALADLNLPEPHVYASRYIRAQQTALHIAEALGVKTVVLEGVQEMDTGNWNGRPYSALEVSAEQIRHPEGGFGFEDGENVEMVGKRLRQALEQALNNGGTPIIVSHGLALRVWLSQLLGVNFDDAWNDQRFAHRNAAFSELVWNNVRWQTVSLGNSGHLDTVS